MRHFSSYFVLHFCSFTWICYFDIIVLENLMQSACSPLCTQFRTDICYFCPLVFLFVCCYIVINGIIVNIDCSPVCTHPHTQLYRQLLSLFFCCCSCPFIFVYCYCYWWINCQHWLLTVVHSSSYTVVQTGAAAAPYPWVLNSFFFQFSKILYFLWFCRNNPINSGF